MTHSTQFPAAPVCALPTALNSKLSRSTTKTVFDFRSGQAGTLPLYLEFIHTTFKQIQALSTTQKTEFVVIFMGAAVTLLSTRQSEQSAQQMPRRDLETKLRAMGEDGIKLEICQLAAKAFGVDMGALVPGLLQVPNGWMSLIHYQAQGHSLIPVY